VEGVGKLCALTVGELHQWGTWAAAEGVASPQYDQAVQLGLIGASADGRAWMTVKVSTQALETSLLKRAALLFCLLAYDSAAIRPTNSKMLVVH
jgi:hypothetical protein